MLQQVEPGIGRVQERLLAPLTAAEAKTLVRLLAQDGRCRRGRVATTDVTPRVIDVQAFIDAQPVSPLQKRLLFLCFLVIAIDGFDTAIIGFIAPAIRRSGGCAVAQLGPLFAAGLFGLMLGAFAVGPLADRHGRKTMLVASMIVFGAASLASSYSGGLTSLIASALHDRTGSRRRDADDDHAGRRSSARRHGGRRS